MCRGRLGRESALLQGRPEAFSDSFRIAKHLVIPEPQHAYSTPRQKRRTALVGERLCGLRMLAAVEFDGEPRRIAVEVQHVGRYLCLATELETTESAVAKHLPQQPLGVGRSATKAACVLDQMRRQPAGNHGPTLPRRAPCDPSPLSSLAPLPQAGEGLARSARREVCPRND